MHVYTNMKELIIDGTFTGVQLHFTITLACWGLMLLAVIIDMWSGVSAAKAVGEQINSHGLRRTFAKAGDYWRIMLFGLFFDLLGLLFPQFLLPYATLIITAGVLLIELRSVIENARKKKSAAADIPDIIKEVMKAIDKKSAIDVLDKIADTPKTEIKNVVENVKEEV